MKDAKRSAALKTVYEALVSMGVDALISIGGDDTLKSANKFKLYQETLPPKHKHIPVVHLPKTIDNDYSGIDFTFGYFTAVEVLAGEIRNLLADSESNRSYFIAETMGRTAAGWPTGPPSPARPAWSSASRTSRANTKPARKSPTRRPARPPSAA